MKTKTIKNYRKDYKCRSCKATKVRLWREYQTFADRTDLLCAPCAVEKSLKSEYSSFGKDWKPGQFFDYDDGDQIGSYVPAVPTPEGDTFWGYSSVPDEDIAWWEAFPTYGADPDKELACLRKQYIKAKKQAQWISKSYREARDEISDLKWRLQRVILIMNKRRTITIWGSKEAPAGDGMVLRYGEEMPKELNVGDKIAICFGRAVVFCNDDYDQCPSIMDCDRDGDALMRVLVNEGSASYHELPRMSDLE